MLVNTVYDRQAVEITAIRAQGSGGQNVNKVSTAVQLRFSIMTAGFSAQDTARLLAYPDRRITSEGDFVLKAQRFRTQELNRQDALLRLQAWLDEALKIPLLRVPTRPTKASRIRRGEAKDRRSSLKKMRERVHY